MLPSLRMHPRCITNNVISFLALQGWFAAIFDPASLSFMHTSGGQASSALMVDGAKVGVCAVPGQLQWKDGSLYCNG